MRRPVVVVSIVAACCSCVAPVVSSAPPPGQPGSATAAQAAQPNSAADSVRPAPGTPARSQFIAAHPCPVKDAKKGSCPGWIVGYLRPLACGGRDDPSNMQWQTPATAKDKVSWERTCHQRSKLPAQSAPTSTDGPAIHGRAQDLNIREFAAMPSSARSSGNRAGRMRTDEPGTPAGKE